MKKEEPWEELMRLLLANPGEYQSGEAISQRLGVTRAAVWKEITRLRGMGWRIDSVTNRGYRLAQAPDLLTRPLVESCLPPERSAPVYCYPTLDSTNTQAQRLALEGAPQGTVVLADSQTQGVGRMGRSFYSPTGVGIYLSYLLTPGCPGEELGLLTSLAGLAVCDAITGCTGLVPDIKWPNDIILEGKKVCGILTKLVSDGENNRISHAVLGIGINVSQQSFPQELRDKAISLAMAGAAIPRARLAGALITRLDEMFAAGVAGQPREQELEQLRERSCTLGKQVVVLSPTGEEQGLAVDIAPQGGLVVRFAQGERTVTSGEVSVRGLLGYL